MNAFDITVNYNQSWTILCIHDNVTYGADAHLHPTNHKMIDSTLLRHPERFEDAIKAGTWTAELGAGCVMLYVKMPNESASVCLEHTDVAIFDKYLNVTKASA